MFKYETIIYWSAEDDAFVAEIPQLPGCVAHGATAEEALHNAKEAGQLWLDTAADYGDPVPEPKGRRSKLKGLLDALEAYGGPNPHGELL